MSDHLTFLEEPQGLRRPLIIMAFSGWNDAAESATTAARYLSQLWPSRTIASIDPEEFYHFGLSRPYVRFKPGSQTEREIIWPATEFSLTQAPGLDRDVIVGVAIEPHLKWRTYCRACSSWPGGSGPSLVLTLGALLGEVPHTRPVRLSGGAYDPELAARLGVRSTRYEGPTGIVGVLNTACRDEAIPTASLWANVPHYISGIENPKAALALVRRVLSLLEHRGGPHRSRRGRQAVRAEPERHRRAERQDRRVRRQAREEEARRGRGAPSRTAPPRGTNCLRPRISSRRSSSSSASSSARRTHRLPSPAGRAAPAASLLLALLACAAAPAAALDVRFTPSSPTQGDVAMVVVSGVRGAREVEGRVGERPLAFFPYGEAHAALVGVDLESGAGKTAWSIAVIESSGARQVRSGSLTIRPGRFSVERLRLPVGHGEPRSGERAPGGGGGRAAACAVRRRRRLIGSGRAGFSRPVAGDGPWTGFGARRIINDQPRMPHSGADYAAAAGTPVTASNRGRVALVGEFFFAGRLVVLDHGLGLYTLYFHLDRVDVAEGALVERGQPIGTVGATGRATGPHLHWGAVLREARVNPAGLLSLATSD